MKTKITVLAGLLLIIMTGCFNSDREDEATLTVNLGGSSTSRAALTSWPPKDDTQFGTLSYEIILSGPTNKTVSVSGSKPIVIPVTAGHYEIEVTAWSDGELYAYGVTSAVVNRGRNSTSVIMRRAGKYEIRINILEYEISIARGNRFTFSASTFYGTLVNPLDKIHGGSGTGTYIWSVSGNESNSTRIDQSGTLLVDTNEKASTLTVTATSENSSSIYGTALVTVVDIANAQTPVILTQPQSAAYIKDSTANDLTVAAYVTDGGTLSYKWYKSTDPSAFGSLITGETDSGYTPDITALGTYYYYVEITNENYGSHINGNHTATITSDVVTVHVSIIDVVRINAGNFQMGQGDIANATPVHTVKLTKGFYMGKYEVTQEQYKVVTASEPSNFNGGKRPVEQVTWYDAVEFCNKLSDMEGLEPVYTITGRTPAYNPGNIPGSYPITGATVNVDWTKNGYRLPTEAEWEYACRAETSTVYSF